MGFLVLFFMEEGAHGGKSDRSHESHVSGKWAELDGLIKV